MHNVIKEKVKNIISTEKKNVLVNVALFPEKDCLETYSLGIENRLFLNGKYLTQRQEGDLYTITNEAYQDLIDGIKMALGESVDFKEILIDKKKAEELAGRNWEEWGFGLIWLKVEFIHGLQQI